MAMIFTNPTKIVFESDMDIVNYVSGGTSIPSRKDFELVMGALKASTNAEPDVQIVEAGSEKKTVTINIDAIPDNELLEKYMRQVYENRCQDRYMHIAGVILASSVALLAGKMLGKRAARKEYEDKLPDYNDGRHSLCVGDELVDGDIPEIY